MEKQNYKEKLKHQIDDLFAKVEELEAKKEKASSELKLKYNEKISEINKLKDDLKTTYKSVENSSEEDLNKKKELFNASIESFKEGFSKLAGIFK